MGHQMSTLLDFAILFISVIPITIIGWFFAMAWAIWGRSDPNEYAKQSGRL